MSLTDALLIVVIIILIWFIVKAKKPTGPARVNTYDCINRDTGALTSVRIAKQPAAGAPSAKGPGGCALPEKEMQANNAEYFTQCSDPNADAVASCPADGTFPYATASYGAPGLDFKDWVTSQSVDPQVLKNHAEFVSDRMNGINTQNVTGRTWSPSDSYHQSYQPITWIGLRRPQAVPKCNPDQDPDIDESEYATSSRLTWKTS
jgi:hypothetical protein